MGFLGWLFGKTASSPESPLVSREDPVFGTIVFGNGSWFREGHLPNSPTTFELMIDAPQSGPTDFQREFFRKLMADFSPYQTKGQQFVDQHRADKKPISVYALELGPDEELKRGEFVIEFADADAFVIYRAVFVDWEPREYGEDD